MAYYGICKMCGTNLTRHYQTWSGYCDSCIELVPKDWSILDNMRSSKRTGSMTKEEIDRLTEKGQSLQTSFWIDRMIEKLRGRW